MADDFANNPFSEALSGIAKNSLPKQGRAGSTAEKLIRQARKARKAKKTGDADYDRECELFMRHMEGVDQSAGGRGREEADGAFFLSELGAMDGLESLGGKGGKRAGTKSAAAKADRHPAGREKKRPDAGRGRAAVQTPSAQKTGQPGSQTAGRPSSQPASGRTPRPADADDEPSMAQLLDGEAAAEEGEGEMTMHDLMKSDEGDPAFAKAMRDVQPLRANGREVVPAVETRPAPSAEGNALQDFLDGKLEFALSCTDEYIEGHVVGLDLLTVGRLRQGGFSPEASVDLHGMNIQQAFETLRVFVKASYLRGMRCLIIVPGRGKNSPDGIGVLREKVRLWLTQDPFKRVVLAFCTARPHDGGPGSLYVLLRKYKKKGRVYWDRTPADSDLF
ncbi:MAG: Smr/MutS family protein [Desulfovibrionaceae bacterium]|nr:Smr/MutS family protein [Desulfovibrionaceae bacterium]